MNADQYRPTTWDEIVGQATDEIRALVDGRDTPDMLFYGPPGTGKTTVAYQIARDLQGTDKELMEFNASDERGIDVVREQIIPATRQGTLTGAPRVIFLDEMDSMTKEAQQALRQPMEQSDAVFLLACNDITAVHGAIKSRCYEFHFGEIDDSHVKELVHQIADEQDITLSTDQIETIASFANGDMRAAIQRLRRYETGDSGDETIQQAAQNFGD